MTLRSCPRNDDWDKWETGPLRPRDVGQRRATLAAGKGRSCGREQIEEWYRRIKPSSAGILPAVPSVSCPRKVRAGRPHDSRRDGGHTKDHNAARNFLTRCNPRSSSATDVAYETRMWSRVPKPSPGTVATCASRNNFPARSEADFTPVRPKNADTLG